MHLQRDPTNQIPQLYSDRTTKDPQTFERSFQHVPNKIQLVEILNKEPSLKLIFFVMLSVCKNKSWFEWRKKQHFEIEIYCYGEKKITFKLDFSLKNLLPIYKLIDKQKYMTKEDPKE